MRKELKNFVFEKKLKVLNEKKGIRHLKVQDETALAKGLDSLFILHEKRARSRNIKSEFITAEAKRFHTSLSRYFLKENFLNLHLLYQGETPVSALYGFNYKDKSCVYQ